MKPDSDPRKVKLKDLSKYKESRPRRKPKLILIGLKFPSKTVPRRKYNYIKPRLSLQKKPTFPRKGDSRLRKTPREGGNQAKMRLDKGIRVSFPPGKLGNLLQRPRNDQEPFSPQKRVKLTETSSPISFKPPPVQISESMTGIPNIGNSCFFSAALNALFATEPFRTLLQYHVQDHESNPFYTLLSRFCRNYSDLDAEKVLFYSEEFRDKRQHCAHAYLLNVLKELDKAGTCQQIEEPLWGKYRKGKCEKLHDIFGVVCEHDFFCMDCGNKTVSMTYGRTLDVPIPLKWAKNGEIYYFPNPLYTDIYPHNVSINPPYSLPLGLIPKTTDITLDLCIKFLLRSLQMHSDSLLFCPKCTSDRPHYKETLLRHIGKVLVIHFQRYNEVSQSKLDTMISIPLLLDLRNFGYFPVFRLYAIVCHWGSLTFGHYTAYIRSMEGETDLWKLLNDSQTRDNIPYEQIPIQDAYILFYAKV